MSIPLNSDVTWNVTVETVTGSHNLTLHGFYHDVIIRVKAIVTECDVTAAYITSWSTEV